MLKLCSRMLSGFGMDSKCTHKLNKREVLPGASILPEIQEEAEKVIFLLFGQVCQMQAAALQQKDSSVTDI